VDISEKKEVAYKDREYMGAKSKGYDSSMKRVVKDYPLNE
jgi:hypothetical protein